MSETTETATKKQEIEESIRKGLELRKSRNASAFRESRKTSIQLRDILRSAHPHDIPSVKLTVKLMYRAACNSEPVCFTEGINGISAEGFVTDLFSAPEEKIVYPLYHGINIDKAWRDLRVLVEDLIFAKYQACGGTEYFDTELLIKHIEKINTEDWAKYGEYKV